MKRSLAVSQRFGREAIEFAATISFAHWTRPACANPGAQKGSRAEQAARRAKAELVDVPEIQYATTDDGVRIAYTSFGQGPPLLATFPLAWDFEMELQSELRGAFYRILAERFTVTVFDYRGGGNSERATGHYTFPHLAQDLAAVARAAAPRRAWPSLLLVPPPGPR